MLKNKVKLDINNIPSKKDIFLASLVSGSISSIIAIFLLEITDLFCGGTKIITIKIIDIWYSIGGILIYGFAFGVCIGFPYSFCIGLIFRYFYNHKSASLVIFLIGFVGGCAPLMSLLLYFLLSQSSLYYFGISNFNILIYSLIFGISGGISGEIALSILRKNPKKISS